MKHFCAITQRYVILLSICLIPYGPLATKASALEEKDLRKLRSVGHCVECDLTEANFFQADLEGRDLRGTDLVRSDIRQANLQGIDL